MNDCPLEICFELKGVDLELVKVVVEREATSQDDLFAYILISLVVLALFSFLKFR
jgi:hypothetical protein